LTEPHRISTRQYSAGLSPRQCISKTVMRERLFAVGIVAAVAAVALFMLMPRLSG
jgi:hypothetical protein